MKLKNIEAQIELYLLHCRNKRLSPLTLEAYSRMLRRLRILIENKKDLGEFLCSKADKTHCTYLTVWKTFTRKYFPPLKKQMEDLLLPRYVDKEPQYLTEDESQKIKALDLTDRQKLYLYLFLDLGLRLNELHSLSTLNFDNEWIRLVRKGGNIQSLPLSVKAQQLYQALALRSGERVCNVSMRTLQKWVKEWGMEATGKNITPHSLRHSFATHAMHSGVHVTTLQRFMGHTSINSTGRYLHVTPQDLKDLQKKITGE